MPKIFCIIAGLAHLFKDVCIIHGEAVGHVDEGNVYSLRDPPFPVLQAAQIGLNEVKIKLRVRRCTIGFRTWLASSHWHGQSELHLVPTLPRVFEQVRSEKM